MDWLNIKKKIKYGFFFHKHHMFINQQKKKLKLGKTIELNHKAFMVIQKD